ncbi:hypothetical protein LTR66_010279 [Elasticomyces elasticus]|nr:hypothetical protein LTR66_010279 [Elasticomyces elasticus]
MGKLGRFACIFTPMALTITSLVLTILLLLGGSMQSSGTLNSLHFFSADFSNFSVPGSDSSALAVALTAARKNGSIADFYHIHLFNYCSGKTVAGANGAAAEEKVDYCSPRSKDFWFDPVAVWDLSGTAKIAGATSNIAVVNAAEGNATAMTNRLLGDAAAKGLDAYRRVAGWMCAAYIASLCLGLATVLLGIFAIFSRIGSMITTIVAVLSTLLLLAATLTSTLLFSSLLLALRALLHPYNTTLSLSRPTLTLDWLAVLLSAAATIFWLFSSCCCSGRSHHAQREAERGDGSESGWGRGRGRGMRAEKTGGYERVASPNGAGVPLRDLEGRGFGGGQRHGFGGAQAQGLGVGYEPYRHV